jgi:hypothetical protein
MSLPIRQFHSRNGSVEARPHHRGLSPDKVTLAYFPATVAHWMWRLLAQEAPTYRKTDV